MRAKMEICFRKGKENDLSEIMDLVQSAILHMERLGIMQWDTLYPDVNDFSADLAAEQFKINAIRLDVFSQNPFALKLYEKCGYAKTGTVNWRKGIFYLMEKYLFHPHVDPLTVIDGSVQ